MKTKRVALFAVIAALILMGGVVTWSFKIFAVASQTPPTVHALSIMKVNNVWKVVDAEDSTKTLVIAKRGEKVIWTARGSDVYFQFMDKKLFGWNTKTLKDGRQLVLPVGRLARSGPNPYAVFCLADKQFATGDSAPVIIIVE